MKGTDESALGARGGFLRATIVLTSSTAVSHMLTLALMPVLSRMYKPAQFGLLAVFAASLSTVAVAAALRFDVAVALPKSDNDAQGLLVLSLASAALVSLALLGPVLLASAQVAAWLGQPELGRHLWLLPIGVFAASASSALQNWNIRQQRFATLAKLRLSQSAATGGIQLAGGVLGIGALGLMLGYVASSISAVAMLGPRALQSVHDRSQRLSHAELWSLARVYRRFPAFSTWEALANLAAIQVPIVIVAATAAPAEAGFLILAMNVLQAPMSLLGVAVGQVYLSGAPEQYHQGRLGPYTVSVLEGLLKGGLGPLVAIGIVAPGSFGLLFGAGWGRAGELVAWMTPWFVLQFLVSPVSMALHMMSRQRAAMLFQFFSLGVRVAAVWGAARWWPEGLGQAYAISGAVVYAIYLILVLRVVGVAPSSMRAAIAKALPATLVWLVVGIVVRLFAAVGAHA